MRVIRLKNTPKGQPYGIESVGNPDDPEQVAAQWWASKGTLAVVIVRKDGTEDSRYEREWIDKDRVPEGWVSRKEIRRPGTTKKRAAWKDVRVREAPQRPEVSIDLFNPEEERQERPQPVTGDMGRACWTCKAPIPVEGRSDAPDAPSARLNLGLCPECGRKVSDGPKVDLLRAYLKAQGKARPKPDNSQLPIRRRKKR